MANVETRMSAMNVQRRRYDCDELHTRPAHIADTTGLGKHGVFNVSLFTITLNR